MDNNKIIKYFCEYIDSNGFKHWAIHLYNRVNGVITSMRDYKFDE